MVGNRERIEDVAGQSGVDQNIDNNVQTAAKMLL